MPTIQEVATLAGVSVGSVSRYINGKNLRPQTATSIQKAIDELGYQANIFGKALRGQRSYSVGVLVNDINNVFSSAIYTSVEAGFQKAGYTTLMMDYRGNERVLKSKLKFMLSRQVDAIVLVMSEQKLHDTKWLEDIKVPMVIMDNPVLTHRFPGVVVDNEHSVASVIRKMMAVGHERIGMIAPPDDTYVGQQRRNGWYDAYEVNDRMPNPDDLIVCPYDIDSGYQAMLKLLDRGQVTAVFAANYYQAVGALKAIFERHLVLGKDLGFASFDDLGVISSITSPPITVVEQPVERMAYYAVTAIIKMLENSTETWPTGIQMFNSHIKFSNSIVRKPR
ncbi:LacI family DNA-binding transcriptional regulator [Lactiplantibacillus carotarum]|uniref:LacI family DNA-binding transcriptional regulator n=1 Tax=Lactiplantibacillus carotarum TaxID=2993456 RepID=UPI00298ED71A|nr:LacI family DNA-binding transcriptional regulator [Lactiplantibacillus carotarum]